MRLPSTHHGRDADWDATMTPMIDVVFLLMVFFVWTASFQVVEYSLPGAVAQAAGSAPADPLSAPPVDAEFDTIVIRVLTTGGASSWELDGQVIDSLPVLRERLGRIAAIRATAPVIVHPDPETPMGAAIDAYDAALSVGLAKVAFAARGN